MLTDLTDKEFNCHTIMCDSGKLDLFVYDTLKKVCNGNKDTIFYINNKSDVEEMVSLGLIMPAQADQWLFIVNYDKVKRHRKKIINHIKLNLPSSKFLVKFSKYIDFKKFNDDISVKNNSMYLKSIRLADMGYLFRKSRLSKELKDFIYHSYRSEVEKIMELIEYLEEGNPLRNRKDITDLVGLSTGSVQHFVFQLLSKKPLNEKSQSLIIKNRIRTLNELSKVYGVRGTRTLLLRILKDILDIKTLYLSGEVYKSLDRIPEGYDSKRLLRYRSYYSKIVDTSYSSILELYLLLYNQGNWSSEVDLFRFIYTHYRNIGFEVR